MQELKNSLGDIIKELFGIEIEPEVTVAPEGVEADFSSNVAMRLAGQLHKAPMEIAEQIAEKVDFTGNVEVSRPGFLNFISPDEYFVEKLGEMRGDFAGAIACDEYAGKTVVCEFSDPNPFKVLHVGHLYTSVVGDAISRLIEFAGGRVIRANFGGDVGLHVAKTIYALKDKNTDNLTIEDIAKCYVEGTRAYDEDEQAHKEIVQLNKEIYAIAEGDLHDSRVAELYWRGRELSYKYFEDFYAKIGLKFDKYYPESEVAGRGLKEVRKGLKGGVYEESDGAVVYKGEKCGLHTRVFINNEGLPTYEAKDVGLIFTKWDDWKFDESVVITGNDIVDYMKVVLKSVGEMNAELPKRTTHLTHGNVKLPGSVKMSSRKGNFLKAVEVLEMIAEALKRDYKSEDFMVALGATKYAFLKYKIGGDIIFDIENSVKMTGNSGPYLQYSCVRAKKILSNKKGEVELKDIAGEEKALVKKIIEYKGVLGEVVREKAPHKLCNYLYELAQEFSRFYEKCPVVGNEREGERMEIVGAYLDVMTSGLDLLGIEIPEEM
ncbi:arginine--tRNA ligase [Candidatus Saccharibacteria bacterium]|nr:arginine--tRNA ligase [Candidatus Saccharibacteria bacterium]